MQTVRLHVALFFAVALGLLTGCGALGLKTANTFEDKAYAVASTIDSMQKVAASLVRSRKISADDGQKVLDAGDKATVGIAAARSVLATNPTEAANRLAAIDAALTVLQGLLGDAAAVPVGVKPPAIVIPATLAK